MERWSCQKSGFCQEKSISEYQYPVKRLGVNIYFSIVPSQFPSMSIDIDISGGKNEK